MSGVETLGLVPGDDLLPDDGQDAAVVDSKVHGRPEELRAEVASLTRRLSRIEGQIRGIKRMLSEGRDCRELVTQFTAVSKALEQAAFNYVTAQLVFCIEEPEAAGKEGYSVDEVKRLLAKLR